jgi:hypothetical protein
VLGLSRNVGRPGPAAMARDLIRRRPVALASAGDAELGVRCLPRSFLEAMSLGGDLQMLSSPQIESNSRGNQLGHAVLRSILGAGGGRPPLLSWRLPRSSGRVFPEEGTYGHDAAKAALRRYWEASDSSRRTAIALCWTQWRRSWSSKASEALVVTPTPRA